jgi:hypothetical protein
VVSDKGEGEAEEIADEIPRICCGIFISDNIYKMR